MTTGGPRLLSPVQAEAILAAPRYTVSRANLGYQSLNLEAAHCDRQARAEARQPDDIAALPYFVADISRWLPSNRERLLWIAHWETTLLDAAPVEAIWRGLEEGRTPSEAPGLLLPAYDWSELDPMEISREHWQAASLLAGILALMMMSQSDGWLVSPGSADRIEFWEGNVLFYSDSPDQLARAREITAEFCCAPWQ